MQEFFIIINLLISFLILGIITYYYLKNIKKINLKDYYYNLPKESIAQKPLDRRDNSKLMIASKNDVEHKSFSNIIDYLKKDDVLVINETKVMKTVIFGKKSTGSPARITILKKLKENIYSCRIKSRDPKIGTKLIFKNLKGKIIKKNDGIYTVEFNKRIESVLKLNGKVLLPDYIKEEIIDEKDYQTIYANKQGSFAAPTAGLHFTKSLIKKIKSKGVKIAKVCLHVSYGTFLPVYDIKNHKMEKEYYEINEESAELINNAKRLFVVGTTSLKTLESCIDKYGKIIPVSGNSDLFITPKHKIRTKIYGLITNFHIPKSTLLLLVSSFFGRKKILELYKIAIKKKYRFYSFGDAMLLIKD